ncbi:MAG: histone deacetylase, partial [Verrucomicrobia bacterium]|nr:histone deacetylase [Verrucomicrobiota bacterium]
THHAFPDNGQGFCLLNDVAVAIRKLQQSECSIRVMVIDTDAHQGNGTHAIFRNDPGVFTYSIHVAKNYPSIKEPGDLDVGLDRWVIGEEYLQALAATLPDAIEMFDPDLLIWISGADTHEDDRFGQMRLTASEMKMRDSFVLDLHRIFEIPTAVLYGGGYNRRNRYTAMLHAQTIRLAALTDRAMHRGRSEIRLQPSVHQLTSEQIRRD